MKKLSKTLSLFLTTLLIGTTLAGCGKSSNSAEASKSTESTKGKTIRVWSRLNSAEVEALKKQCNAWAEKTGNKIEFTLFNQSSDTLTQVAKSPKCPDVMWGLSNGHTGAFARSGILEEVPSDVIDESKFLDKNVLNTLTYNGKSYGIPLFGETYALFYNKDKVEQAPETWEELVKIGKEKGFEYDIANFYYSFGLIASNGGYVFKDNNGTVDVKDIGLDNEGSVKGFEMIKGLVDEGLMSASSAGDIPKNNFKTGKNAFYIGGPWDMTDFKKEGINFGVAPIPKINGEHGKSFLGIQAGYVFEASKNKDLAWDLVKYLSEENQIKELLNAGGRIPVMKNMDVSDEAAKGFLEQVKYAVPKPIVPEMTLVWEPEKSALEAVITGNKTPKEAAEFAAKGIREKIKLTE